MIGSKLVAEFLGVLQFGHKLYELWHVDHVTSDHVTPYQVTVAYDMFTDVDECIQNRCPPDMKCTNYPGTYSCACHDGTFWNGKLCQRELYCCTMLFPMAWYPVCLGVLSQVWPQICETKLKSDTLIHCDICTRWATISKTTNKTLPRQIRLDVTFLLICTLLNLELVYFIFLIIAWFTAMYWRLYILFNISIFYLCVYMYSHKSFSAHTF